MASLPEEARRLRNESPRPRVPLFNRVMIAVSLVVGIAAIGLVMTHPRSPALAAYSRLFSLRTWRILEVVSFLLVFGTVAISRAKARSRT